MSLAKAPAESGRPAAGSPATSGSDAPPLVWLDVGQLSTYLSVPVNTLLHWRKNATGPRYHKFGRAVRYARADVDSWVASCAVGKPASSPI
jgi:predicted DNA-binding transcriptional regulator AlpA